MTSHRVLDTNYEETAEITNQLSGLSKDVATLSEAVKSYKNEISEIKSMFVQFQDEMKNQVQSLAVTLQQNSSEEAVKRQVLSMFERIHEGLKIAMGPRSTSEETTTVGEDGKTGERQSSVPPSAMPVSPMPQVAAGSNQRPSPTPVPPAPQVTAENNRQNNLYPIIHLESFYINLICIRFISTGMGRVHFNVPMVGVSQS